VVEYVFNLLGPKRPPAEPRARGGAMVAWFDSDAEKNEPAEEGLSAEPDELWERLAWFLERAVPAAEKAGVRLGCHHDDPPVPRLGGETRILYNLDGMKRLVETVPSEANGLTLCLGTIAEMGEDVIETIRYFGSRGKINHVHFRNVKGSVPLYVESFIDDGDTDMLEAMRALDGVGYEGLIIPDHVPRSDRDGFFRGSAFALGYMKALMKAAGIKGGG
jgi:mannonate dehydratase